MVHPRFLYSYKDKLLKFEKPYIPNETHFLTPTFDFEMEHFVYY